MTYSGWLEKQIEERARRYGTAAPRTRFSALTTVYERTNAEFFRETAKNVFAQGYGNWEWVVLAHGSVGPSVDQILKELSRDPRCRVLRLEANRGPMGGLRHCLEHASGDYIVPLDADDLMTCDALSILNHYIVQTDKPAYVFSDEDHLFGETLSHPWLRPGFDEVLLKANSYIWHLAVFRRDLALTLEIYQDRGAEWCHDWDTALRFAESKHECVHVPHVLYHWRHHKDSTTNTARPESGSLRSQRHVLERQVRLHSHPELFEVREFPIFRGATEYAVTRRPISPAHLEIIIWGYHSTAIGDAAGAALRTAEHPVSRVHVAGAKLAHGDRNRIRDLGAPEIMEYGSAPVHECFRRVLANAPSQVAIFSERVLSLRQGWPWACDGLFRLHPKVAALSGLVLDSNDYVMSAGDIFGFDGLTGSPHAQQPASDPGYFALTYKPHCCSAPYSELMAVRVEFIQALIARLPKELSWGSLGLWIGAEAFETGRLVAYTPLLSAKALHSNVADRIRATGDETRQFLSRYAALLPDTRWYSEHYRWICGGGYKFRRDERS